MVSVNNLNNSNRYGIFIPENETANTPALSCKYCANTFLMTSETILTFCSPSLYTHLIILIPGQQFIMIEYWFSRPNDAVAYILFTRNVPMWNHVILSGLKLKIKFKTFFWWEMLLVLATAKIKGAPCIMTKMDATEHGQECVLTAAIL